MTPIGTKLKDEQNVAKVTISGDKFGHDQVFTFALSAMTTGKNSPLTGETALLPSSAEDSGSSLDRQW